MKLLWHVFCGVASGSGGLVISVWAIWGFIGPGMQGRIPRDAAWVLASLGCFWLAAACYVTMIASFVKAMETVDD